jgi:hypothetical protein
VDCRENRGNAAKQSRAREQAVAWIGQHASMETVQIIGSMNMCG